MIGSRLGSYEITAKLGEGGMGAVYRARDSELERDVAIKVLPEAFTEDPDRVGRFEREAKLLASLNHPNIGQIYGLASEGARKALVMERVEGETLGERVRRGPLEPREALEIARQIAEALEAAHGKGIVHRDLKPENVKIDREGRVKVLDFGLAKAMEPADPTAPGSMLANSPTLTAAAGTLKGAILGTAAYMSPEQAKGGAVDERADIWAFGVVLYEMLTGERLFTGDSVAEVLAGLLAREVDLSTVPPETPAAVRRLLRRCLVRDPRNRLHDIADARIVLDEVLDGRLDEEAAGGSPASPGTARRGVPIAAAAGLALLLGVVGFAVGRGLRTETQAEPPSAPAVSDEAAIRKVTLGPGLEAEPSFSPDGNSVAYTTDDRGSLDIVILPLAGGEERRIAASPADEASPAWSPDGTRIAYTAARGEGRLKPIVGLDTLTAFVQGQGGDVYLVPTSGGLPTRLVEEASFPAWSPDARQVAFTSQRGGHWDIWRISAEGGAPTRVSDDPFVDFQPAWSPDGAWIAFASGEGLRVAPADGGAEPITVVAASREILSPTWSPDGRWIYFSQARRDSFSLWRIRFDPDPESRESVRPERISLGESSDVDLDMDSSGRRLAWSKVEYQPDLYSLEEETGEITRITNTSCAEVAANVTADGRFLLFDTNCRGGRSLATLDLETGARQSVSPGGVDAIFGRWSPDGRSLAYLRMGEEGLALVMRSRDALDDRVLVQLPPERGVQPPKWMPDGRHLVFSHGTGVTGETISIVSLDGEVRDVFTAGEGNVLGFPISTPDGKTIVFQHERAGELRQLWAVPAEGGEPRPITNSELEHSHPEFHPNRPDDVLITVNHQNVALVSMATGEVTYLTHFEESTNLVDYPTWGADGRTIYFDFTKKVGDLFLLENPEE